MVGLALPQTVVAVAKQWKPGLARAVMVPDSPRRIGAVARAVHPLVPVAQVVAVAKSGAGPRPASQVAAVAAREVVAVAEVASLEAVAGVEAGLWEHPSDEWSEPML